MESLDNILGDVIALHSSADAALAAVAYTFVESIELSEGIALPPRFTLSGAFVGFGARVLISVLSKLRASYRQRKSFFTQSPLFSSSSVFWEDRCTLGYPFVLCAERNRT